MQIYNNYESCLQWLALRLWRLTPLSIETKIQIYRGGHVLLLEEIGVSWRKPPPVIDIVSFTVILSITTGVVVSNSPVIDIVSFTVILSITTAVVFYNSPVIDIVSFTVILSITTALVFYNSPVIDI
jgi:hypothetical protein